MVGRAGATPTCVHNSRRFPMFPVIASCSRITQPTPLAAASWDDRIHYSQERDGYASLYLLTTVRDVQRFLRGEIAYPIACDDDEEEATPREEVIVDLLDASRDDPHPVWTLLLVVAFEEDLRKARDRLGKTPDAADDQRVASAFERSVDALTRFEEIRASARFVQASLRARITAMLVSRRRQASARRVRRAAGPPMALEANAKAPGEVGRLKSKVER
jgi:hypothetical protein